MPASENGHVEQLHECLVCGSRSLLSIDEESFFSRCRACGYIFDNPRPATKAIIHFYSRAGKYAPWIEQEPARERMWQRRRKKIEAFGPSGSLLDVGAGIGEFLRQARADFAEVVGTEVSAEAVAVARRKYGIELLSGELEGLRLPHRFDLVTLFHVLEHVPDPMGTLRRCFEVLKPGGGIVIAVPNDISSLKQRVKRLLGRMGIPTYRRLGRLALPRLALDDTTPEVHLSHFTPGVLEILLERAGFVDIRMSLDPYYAASGLAELGAGGYYRVCAALWRITGINVYDTIWVDGRRPAAPQRQPEV